MTKEHALPEVALLARIALRTMAKELLCDLQKPGSTAGCAIPVITVHELCASTYPRWHSWLDPTLSLIHI